MILVLSPLWFLIVYAMLVATAPLWFWLHERYGELVPVWMVGIAVVVDVLRFRYRVAGVEWVNMLVVWAIPHQLGFYYERLCAAPQALRAGARVRGCVRAVRAHEHGSVPAVDGRCAG